MLRFARLNNYNNFKWQFMNQLPIDAPFNFEGWYKDENTVYDADVCGSVRDYYVVVDGDKVTYWLVRHEWWITYEPWECHNEFEFEIIDKSAIHNPDAINSLKYVV